MTTSDIPSCHTLETVFGVFFPQRLHMRLAGSLEDYAAGTATAETAATWVHEHMHFFQTIFTGFGQISWDAYRQLTAFLISEWRKIEPVNGKVRLPLGYAATASKRSQTIATVAYMTALEQLTLGACRFSMPNPGATLEEAGARLLKREWPANPTVFLGGQAHVLQGKEIIEGHAQFVETQFLELAGLSREAAWRRETLPAQYVVALDWFMQECGADRYEEFPVVCDLALQTSWGRVVPNTEEEWRQTSPSWRFVRLVEALQRTNLKLGSVNKSKEAYARFANALLSECNFLALNAVLEERLNSLARKPALLHVEELMRRALTYRMQHPWAGVNPASDLDGLAELVGLFPAPLVEIRGQLGNTRPEANTANFEAIAELQYQAMAELVFGDVRGLAAREDALECAFSKYGIHQGCEFQRNAGCPGRYRPNEGTPHPVQRIEGTDELRGCTFEMLLNRMGLSSYDVEVDYQQPPPRF